MADTVLIDTDILIDAGRGIAGAIECLQHHEERATAVANALPLLTKNQSDYRFITGSNMLAYP